MITLTTTVLATASPVIDDINGDKNLASYWWASDVAEVGWYYTPEISYAMDGISTKFGNNASDGRIVTVLIYSDWPGDGGNLLRSGTFNPIANTFAGATFAPLNLTAGETYFFGFQNIQDLRVNTTEDAGAITLPGGFRSSPTANGTFENSFVGDYIGARPVVQFTGVTPEPMSAVLFAGMFAIGGVLARCRKSIHRG